MQSSIIKRSLLQKGYKKKRNVIYSEKVIRAASFWRSFLLLVFFKIPIPESYLVFLSSKFNKGHHFLQPFFHVFLLSANSHRRKNCHIFCANSLAFQRILSSPDVSSKVHKNKITQNNTKKGNSSILTAPTFRLAKLVQCSNSI